MTTKWGIVSTAKIGMEKVIPGLLKAKGVEVAAIASRSLESAQAAADKLGIPKAYGSYEELLNDPEIEIIYNPLPNNMHVPVTLQAVAAGKHVLCEKPIALDAKEAEQLLDLPKDRFVMEAFMVRCHPQWHRAREIIESGELGDIRVVQSVFAYNNMDANNIRNRLDVGGGGLMDIGCYPIVAGRFFFDSDPIRAISMIDRDPEFGTDRLTSGLIDFGNGRRLDFTVSTQSVPYQRLNILGTKKRLELLIPYNAPLGGKTVLRLDDGKVLGDGAIESETIAEADQYQLQGELFARVVRGEEELPFGTADAVMNMRVIDALLRSEATEKWEQI
ncbi:Gfo/Idh/MocA family oxidoreductase [Rhodobacteraceae bacterium RKSG542]|uniref:Gfo/Idh/MocA family protein n=1 Tax=Pseudovibrio flavus TaxID=2529854 RepID=UPI0012BC63FB|nr:Gfo/Idh/MocA family oxidoreductase [Pseudovibrio flavus]MTI16841.1 Gfo/Idh/MocA family oxidoreductase [Pseudovibrio flavus]